MKLRRGELVTVEWKKKYRVGRRIDDKDNGRGGWRGPER